jgi:hypothetical protein
LPAQALWAGHLPALHFAHVEAQRHLLSLLSRLSDAAIALLPPALGALLAAASTVWPVVAANTEPRAATAMVALVAAAVRGEAALAAVVAALSPREVRKALGPETSALVKALASS